MTLAPGARLGSYEILSLLGTGGMGEVYRARDTRLQRDVAIKLISAPLAREPEHLARFEREARMLAALNHPHIAQIHGLEERDGMRFLVLELVEGQPLNGGSSGSPGWTAALRRRSSSSTIRTRGSTTPSGRRTGGGFSSTAFARREATSG